MRLGLHTLPPELEFGVDGTVEDKVLPEALGVEGADGRVVAHLLRYEPETQVLPGLMTFKFTFSHCQTEGLLQSYATRVQFNFRA